MIKYFYYERHFDENNMLGIIKNERILDEKPIISSYGYKHIKEKYKTRYYIDVEEYIKKYGWLNHDKQEVYDKLLIQDRNNKLDTL